MTGIVVAAVLGCGSLSGCATTSGAVSGPGAVKASIGAPAPGFTLPALGGGEVTLSAYAGRVVLLDFWASWCAPCRDELPALELIRAEWEPRGVAFVAVNVDTDRAEAERMARELGVKMPVGLDLDQKVVPLYQPPTMPTSYLIDKKGVVRHVHEGYRGVADDQRFTRELHDLLAE